MTLTSWQEVVSRKLEARASAIASYKASCTLDTLDDALTADARADNLVRRLHAGEVTAEIVIRSYIARAIVAHEKTNCLTEVLFEDALRDAQTLDNDLALANQPSKPLFGVPMTLKDQFNVRGYDSTIGYVGRALKPAGEDATIVKMLKSLGAVMLAKTNLPQSIMWCETENPLWGLTVSPYHPNYTPGGSTGGESALLAQNGSMVGWGTDIGGSIRIPSHMMGLYGFKPSSSRLPYHGVPVSTEGQEHVPSSVGPMARSLSTIETVMKALIDAKPWEWDARCAPIHWRAETYESHLSRHLTIGVLLDDGVVRPHPPITRALQSAVASLKAAGHDIIEWDPSLHAECIAVMDEYYTADGGEDIRIDVANGGEPFIPHVERLVNRGKAISVFEYWQLNRRKWALQQAYLEKWKSIKSPRTGRVADVVIMPPMPHPSVPHGGTRWVGYTKVWNLLDYSALVIPGGKVNSQDVEAEWKFEARNDMDAWNLDLWTRQKEEFAALGLPVGIQIIGRKLEEEKVLAVGRVLDNLVRSAS